MNATNPQKVKAGDENAISRRTVEEAGQAGFLLVKLRDGIHQKIVLKQAFRELAAPISDMSDGFSTEHLYLQSSCVVKWGKA